MKSKRLQKPVKGRNKTACTQQFGKKARSEKWKASKKD